MTAEERFWAKVDKSGDCWAWTGSTAKGYGHVQRERKLLQAHRYAYELLTGPIPNGMQLDHLCRNRICVNPAHLEPVTHRINTLRGNTITAANAAKTHCSNGHEFTPENTYMPPGGGRGCCECRRDYQRRRPPRRRAA